MSSIDIYYLPPSEAGGKEFEQFTKLIATITSLISHPFSNERKRRSGTARLQIKFAKQPSKDISEIQQPSDKIPRRRQKTKTHA